MTAANIISALAVLAGVAVLVLVLIRQGFPDSEGRPEDSSNGEGPTGEYYPSGSRPAGRGAETTHLESSEEMHEERET